MSKTRRERRERLERVGEFGSKVRPGSRSGVAADFKDIYTRPGIRGYLVNIRSLNWKRAVWLGTFNTAREAACARDAVAFYSGQDFEYNYPGLTGAFPQLPSHLRVDSDEDREEIIKFVRRQALEAVDRAKNDEKRGGSGSLSPTLDEREHIQHAETLIVPAGAGIRDFDKFLNFSEECNQQQDNPYDPNLDDELELFGDELYTDGLPPGKKNGSGSCSSQDWTLLKNVDGKAEADAKTNPGNELGREDISQTKPSEQVINCTEESEKGNEGPEWLTESENEEFSEDVGSASHESEAEVTGDSPVDHETTSNYGRKRKLDETNDLIARLAPFIKQQMEEALNATLIPLVSVLRSREEDEQKHREQILALEKEKLALKREKLLFKQRRVTRSQPASPRASYSARPGLNRLLVTSAL